MSINELRLYLSFVAPGPIPLNKVSPLLGLLTKAWDSFDGGSDQSTFSNKLGRAECLDWKPPYLRFTLERHGATVNGSTRGALHHWKVNTDTGVAEIEKNGSRQLSPMSPKLDVKKLALETKARILNHEMHESLEWHDRSQVLLLVSNLIPAEKHQTTQSRRKRFSTELSSAMSEAGWELFRKGSRYGYKMQN